MTRLEKKIAREKKWNSYKRLIVDKFDEYFKESDWGTACVKTDEYIRSLCTKIAPSDKEIILDVAHEFSNQIDKFLKDNLK